MICDLVVWLILAFWQSGVLGRIRRGHVVYAGIALDGPEFVVGVSGADLGDPLCHWVGNQPRLLGRDLTNSEQSGSSSVEATGRHFSYGVARALIESFESDSSGAAV